jgi:hypothetical protein
LQRLGNVARQFDIGEQLHLDAVDRFRLGGLQALELGFLQLDLFLAQLVFVQDALVRIDDDDAAQAVDDQQLAVADQAARVLQAEHGRDRHAAGEDGGVRRGAADIGDEGGEAVFLEGDGVGRRQVVGDDDQASSFDFLAFFSAARPGWPSSSLTTRSTTCTTSNLRSRR